MLIETLSGCFGKARATNATDSAFPSKIPTTTEPTGAGVHDMGIGGGKTANGLIIIPFGVGADNATFTMRVIGWRRTTGSAVPLWIPHILAELSVTVSAVVGVAGADVDATNRFADTIALVAGTGNANVSVEVVSPASDIIGRATVDLVGSQKVEFTFNDGTATSMNALFARI